MACLWGLLGAAAGAGLVNGFLELVWHRTGGPDGAGIGAEIVMGLWTIAGGIGGLFLGVVLGWKKGRRPRPSWSLIGGLFACAVAGQLMYLWADHMWDSTVHNPSDDQMTWYQQLGTFRHLSEAGQRISLLSGIATVVMMVLRAAALSKPDRLPPATELRDSTVSK